MTTMMAKSGMMPMQEMMPGMETGMNGMNMMMVPRGRSDGEVRWRHEDDVPLRDKMAASVLQGLVKMMAGGMCSCAMMMNGMVMCYCNMMMGMCKWEMMEDGA